MESARKTELVYPRAARVALVPALLGAGLLFATFLNVIRFFNDDAGASLHTFVVATGWGAFTCGSLLFTAEAVARSRGLRGPYPTCAVCIACGAAGALGGMLYVTPLYVPVEFPLFHPHALGAAFGAGLMFLASAWGLLFSRLEPASQLLNSAASVALAAMLHFAAELLSPSPAALALVAGSLGASLGLLMIARRTMRPAGDGKREDIEGATDDEENAQAERLGRARKALGILWMPLVGACITCFIFGLTWDPIVSDEPTLADGSVHAWKLLIGPLLPTIAIALALAKKPASSTLRLVNQVIYPIAVALLLALPVVEANNEAITVAVEILKPASFSVIVLAIWFSMASAVRSVPASAALVIPPCLALLAGSFVGGLYAIEHIGTSGRTLCLVILTGYLVLITISYALGSRNQKESRAEPRADARTYIHRRCDALSSACGLSPREREVLYYLGRGYNHGYVAEKLYISENTVRTHVRHIYAKLDVKSREELLALIDETEEAGS